MQAAADIYVSIPSQHVHGPSCATNALAYFAFSKYTLAGAEFPTRPDTQAGWKAWMEEKLFTTTPTSKKELDYVTHASQVGAGLEGGCPAALLPCRLL